MRAVELKNRQLTLAIHCKEFLYPYYTNVHVVIVYASKIIVVWLQFCESVVQMMTVIIQWSIPVPMFGPIPPKSMAVPEPNF